MDEAEVLALHRLLADHGIEVWLDGGWGVDALVGEQTRPHVDLDIAVKHEDVPKLRELLGARGYEQRDRDDTTPWMFVLGDGAGHEVDVHSFALDADNKNVYGIAYSAESLTGTGSLQRHEVRCISAEWVVTFHTAYAPRAVDRYDLKVLHERLGVDVPDDYTR
jgi:lincosamide nucleotidyltransferase A/C/D/E